MNILIDPQTKRDEPSNVVDYEKIDEDARVSPNIQIFTTSSLRLWFLKDKRFCAVGFLSNSVINKCYLTKNQYILSCVNLSVSVWSWSEEEGNRRGDLDLHHGEAERPPPAERWTAPTTLTRLTSSHTGSHYTSSPDNQSVPSFQYSILTLFMFSTSMLYPLRSVWLSVFLYPVQMFLLLLSSNNTTCIQWQPFFFIFFQTLFILLYIFVSMTRFFFTLDNNVFHLQYQHLFVLNTKMFYMFNLI